MVVVLLFYAGLDMHA